MTMVNKYAHALEDRDINPKTGEVWKIQDVPTTWRRKVEAKVISDGYIFDDDGTVIKPEPNEEEPVEE